MLEALSNAGFTAEGNASVIFSKEDSTELKLTTLSNLIKSKQTLLKKALSVDEELTVIVTETEVAFSFFNASLNSDIALAYIVLSRLLMEQAKTLKYASPNEKPVDNEKYTFRCFLLRLGLIGDEYKQTRKILLNQLLGSSAFRDGGKKQESGVA